MYSKYQKEPPFSLGALFVMFWYTIMVVPPWYVAADVALTRPGDLLNGFILFIGVWLLVLTYIWGLCMYAGVKWAYEAIKKD